VNLSRPFVDIVATGGLFYGVQKFFKTVEETLNDDTKRLITNWLKPRTTSSPSQNWPETFTRIFDKTFGTKHLSWKCFARSSIVSVLIFILCATAQMFRKRVLGDAPSEIAISVLIALFVGSLTNVIPDYVSLLETRLVLRYMSRTEQAGKWVLLILLDGLVTIAWATAFVLGIQRVYAFLFPHLYLFAFRHPNLFWQYAAAYGEDILWVWVLDFRWTFVVPAFFTSVWLWLYAGSGLFIRLLQETKHGAQLVPRYFDVEKKPLQSIGIVGATLAVLGLWTVELLSPIVHFLR
jgi:hypothetical protein